MKTKTRRRRQTTEPTWSPTPEQEQLLRSLSTSVERVDAAYLMATGADGDALEPHRKRAEFGQRNSTRLGLIEQANLAVKAAKDRWREAALAFPFDAEAFEAAALAVADAGYRRDALAQVPVGWGFEGQGAAAAKNTLKSAVNQRTVERSAWAARLLDSGDWPEVLSESALVHEAKTAEGMAVRADQARKVLADAEDGSATWTQPQINSAKQFLASVAHLNLPSSDEV